ncbi:DUF3048 domain-containing protein [Halanaerobium praevalens]|uniref:Lipoprotein YerB n=1 Tax=Halanaerobium praevalens (strain ATCC 33744 / DSM 2228 / GSL) TaxID=572479 RepID=E3DQ63_HALPG|nr:DUF3048 domain-containing protein [Halanaerobium praevalens]ADO76814.1 hypothetical protein Hprae_0660 [Halanaerobium praevalens DSM 2228]
MKSKLFILMVLLSITLVFLTGCGFKEKSQKPKPEEQIQTQTDLSSQERKEEIASLEEKYEIESSTENQIFENNYEASSPFTGLPTKEEYYNRAVAVAIENSPAARPQTGLDEAAVVYEFMLEGGITRFLAIYWPEIPVKIGPIRSARPALIEIARSYDALFLHAGASPDGFQLLADSKLLNLDQLYKSKYFWRSSKRKAPHNLYSGQKPLAEYIANLTEKEYPKQFNFITASIINDFKEAQNIKIDYWGAYDVLYKYQSLKNNYLRFIKSDNNPHLSENGKQLTAKNIIVQYVNTSTKDDQGRQDIDLSSGGEIKLFRDGIVINGSWEKRNNKIVYLNSKNQKLGINPGQTWIQIVAKKTKVSY